MARRIVINDQGIGRYVGKHAGCGYDETRDACFGTLDMDRPYGEKERGGAIVTNVTDASCMMHFAGRDPMWMSRDLVICVFHYVFVQLDLQRVFTVVKHDNERSKTIQYRLGFEIIGSLPGMFASGDGLLLCLERSRCRWHGLPLRTLRAGQTGQRGD